MSLEQAHRVGREILDFLERNHSDVEPMAATAAMAIALGCMVTSLNEMGLTKQGRTGALLEHLFKIAEQAAVSGAAA